MGKKWTKLSCSQETKELLKVNCIALFRSHHPELDGFHISEEYILRQVIKFYLEA